MVSELIMNKSVTYNCRGRVCRSQGYKGLDARCPNYSHYQSHGASINLRWVRS